MKRTILLATIFSSALVFGQTTPNTDPNLINQNVNDIQPGVDPSTPVGTANDNRTPVAKKDITFETVVAGQTYYDLQSNGSVGRRIVLHADGTVSIVWTTSPNSTNGFPDRGTGYNNGDIDAFPSPVDTRLESSTRTGWPSIGILASDQGDVEFVIAHESTTGGFGFSTNSGIGSTTWNTDAPILDDETQIGVNRVPIWNRSAAGGDYIHMISNYWFSEADGVPIVNRMGVQSPMTYSRSTDGGETWDMEHVLLPGYDSLLYDNGSADNYAIDVRDSIVAIVVSGPVNPVSLWKSTDNGDNFTYIDVDQFPYKGVNIQDMPNGDTVLTNDGTIDVIIDANGMVHVSWGGTITFRDETRTPPENIVFRLTTAFLCYWNEMDPDTVQLVGGTPDLNNDGVLDVLSETFSILSNERVPNGLLSATRTGTSCFVTMPSMSMDPSGNIFIVYTAVVEGLSSRHFLNSQYRDIMIIFSEDDGDSWSDPQNLTQTRQNEEIFACVAKSANDYLHVIWQSDGTPGTNLQNHDPDIDTHAPVLNDIVYAAIPISDILNESIGQIPAGFEPITRDQAAKVFVVSQNFPNPFENNTEVIIYLRAGSDISITVTDMMGNVINQGSLGFMNAGNHTLNIDADGLSAGMYFYTISSGNNSVTKKMQVR